MTNESKTDLTRTSDFEHEDNIGTRNPFKAFWIFLQQVLNELRKVVTPTGKELAGYTVVVLFFVVFMMALVFGMDFVFGNVARALFDANQ